MSIKASRTPRSSSSSALNPNAVVLQLDGSAPFALNLLGAMEVELEVFPKRRGDPAAIDHNVRNRVTPPSLVAALEIDDPPWFFLRLSAHAPAG